MQLSEYQDLAMRTNGAKTQHEMLLMGALGLNGEAGEIAEVIKKLYYHGHNLEIEAFAKEIGDVMWYLALLCEALGLDMDIIAEQNIDKLRKRYPDGFSSERSINRDENH